ncbi:hypothetical protein M569_00919 [Genlisea aurea]|uniref:B box-type domain-containing protein n=1 Tax=Genlisea aurea TaxID=192259 RepID=S8EME7_9LAMI|nr:hypothetical protein M569_00919 [Genlisea aurea]
MLRLRRPPSSSKKGQVRVRNSSSSFSSVRREEEIRSLDRESSMAPDRKLANVVGGKSARACDNCGKKRARWYCAADDAFLCQSCDSSVHSDRALSRRHERVRLKTSTGEDVSPPTWHRGFTKKARTPRQKKNGKFHLEEPTGGKTENHNPLYLVPEICGEEQSQSHEENEEQLLYRVPVFDPFGTEAELGSNSSSSAGAAIESRTHNFVSNFNGFLQPDMDLAEFAADVECLLGKGLDDSCFDMEELGIFDRPLKSEVETALVMNENHQIDEKSIDDLPVPVVPCGGEEYEEDDTKTTFLKLDLDGILSAWNSRNTPWITGQKPDSKSIDFWPDFFGTTAARGDVWAAGGDGGREARVSRYREKRRTRLFSKKIRYEVRKLNAEKRPRMKGRFVKRCSSSSSSAFPSSLIHQ